MHWPDAVPAIRVSNAEFLLDGKNRTVDTV